MKDKIINCLIASYKKLRVREAMDHTQFIGLFINYVYREFQCHTGLSTRDFEVIYFDNIRCLKMRKELGYAKEQFFLDIRKILEEFTQSDYLLFYLRSSFEDPIRDPDGGAIVREIFNNGFPVRISAEPENQISL